MTKKLSLIILILPSTFLSKNTENFYTSSLLHVYEKCKKVIFLLILHESHVSGFFSKLQTPFRHSETRWKRLIILEKTCTGLDFWVKSKETGLGCGNVSPLIQRPSSALTVGESQIFNLCGVFIKVIDTSWVVRAPGCVTAVIRDTWSQGRPCRWRMGGAVGLLFCWGMVSLFGHK